MSAPLLWIGLPLIVALVLWFLQRRRGLVITIASLLSLTLTLLAMGVTINETIRLGPVSLKILPEMVVAGRSIVLDNPERPILVLFYGMAGFWFVGVAAARSHRAQVSLGMAMVALLTAAIAVRPLLLAGLLVEGAVLLSVPMLVTPGQTPGQGVLRYLIFQSLAMPFFLLGGWALAGVEAAPSDVNLSTLTGVFLGLGFAFWLAVFPFYTWAPLLSGQVQPYASGFVFLVLPITVLLLGFNLLGSYGWLRNSADLLAVLRLSGSLMVVTAGVWAAFQRDLGRLFGYTVIIQTGFSLLALSLGSRLGNEIFVMLFLPRVVSLGLWALCASIFRQSAASLMFADLESIGQRYPLASTGLAMAFLSLAGLPLLAEFPMRQVLLQEVSVAHPIAALGVLLGSLGLLFSGFRLLAVITGGSVSPARLRNFAPSESRFQAVLVLGGMAALLLVGVFPHLFFPIMKGLLQLFPAP